VGKREDYAQLVAARRACRRCAGLTNPADVEGGRLDSDQVGPWSLWQGNLDAAVMVVGQDWGDTRYLLRHAGREGPGNPTNLRWWNCVARSVYGSRSRGHRSEQVGFFTNAILCLKADGLQAPVCAAWFRNCAPFLRRQVEIVRPAVVVGLGERAYRSVLESFG
jgi:DNA polymerase